MLVFVPRNKTGERPNCDFSLVEREMEMARARLDKPLSGKAEAALGIGFQIMRAVTTDLAVYSERRGSKLLLTNAYETVILPRVKPDEIETGFTVKTAQIIFSTTRKHKLRKLTGNLAKDDGGEMISASCRIRLCDAVLDDVGESRSVDLVPDDIVLKKASTAVPLLGRIPHMVGADDEAADSFYESAIEIQNALKGFVAMDYPKIMNF